MAISMGTVVKLITDFTHQLILMKKVASKKELTVCSKFSRSNIGHLIDLDSN